MWTDSHCHLQEEYVGQSWGAAEQIARAEEEGVERLICVGTSVQSSAGAIALARSYPNVRATVGLHPHEAASGAESVERFLGSLSSTEMNLVVAVGECGLDYHYDHSPRKEQREAFAAQIALAKRYDKALVVHTRDAWEDTFSILQSEGVPARTVIHCFTGGVEEMERSIELGAWVSFSGIVTFKNAGEIREAASRCPLERVLVETDSPFLAPVPHRGTTNQPSYVMLVGQAIAELKEIPVDQLEEATWFNAAAVFGLPA